MIDEKEKTASDPLDTKGCVPLHHVGAGEAEGESAAAPLLFRGAPICWATAQQTRRVVEKNAVGPDTISDRPGRKVNLIAYKGAVLSGRVLGLQEISLSDEIPDR